MQEKYVKYAEYAKSTEIDELFEVVSLTEKTVDKVNNLKSKIWMYLIALSSLSILFIWGIYFITNTQYFEIDSTTRYLFLVSLVSVSFIFGLVLFREMVVLAKRKRTEIRVARKLFDMIGPLKSNIDESISLTKMALIEMRLNRIDFDNLEKNEFF